MESKSLISCGLIAYKYIDDVFHILLVHPGGPYNVNAKWSIPKGRLDTGEDMFLCAKREFKEETGQDSGTGVHISLGYVTQKSGKKVYAWGFDGNHLNPDTMVSNICSIEFPPNSGKFIDIPEVDSHRFFTISNAVNVVNRSQNELIYELLYKLG